MQRAFDTIDGKPIRWLNGGVMHAVEGAEVAPGETLMWPMCGSSDVPSGRELIGEYEVTCPACIAMTRRTPMVA